jgi:methionyl-tRNA synthetase
LISSPIIPDSAQKIWYLLGQHSELAKESWKHVQTMMLPKGQRLAQSQVLFRKVEDEEITYQIEQLGKSLQANKVAKGAATPVVYEPLKAPIAFEQFGLIDLRVAQVLEAVKVPKSKKLLKLRVDLGFEQRTIISGIALSIDPEKLIGKKIAVVANLAPATIMGIESQGMVLAASHGESLELPSIQHLSPGSTIS